MDKYVIAQTELPEDKIKELKKKTGEKTVKDAIAKAVEHYIICNYTDYPKTSKREYNKKRSGRYPVYLAEILKKYEKINSSKNFEK